MNLISLVIDRLHVGYLGCYGNSWIATPTFDRLAAEGFLFDQALIESPDLPRQYDAFASGRHAYRAPPASAGTLDFVATLQSAGVHTALFTDDPAVADLPWSAEIDDVIRVELPRATEPAADISETGLARLFAVAAEWLEAAAEPFALFMHCGSLATVWDAPLELRKRYWDQSDPIPPADTAAPCLMLPENYHPDQLLGICQAYAGQVTLLDQCLGILLDDWSRQPHAQQTLLSFLSLRGFPLGEHRRIGAVDQSLYGELVHVPWILRFADLRGASDRSQALVQTCDVAPTLLDALGLAAGSPGDCDGQSVAPIVAGEPWLPRDRAIVVGDGERAIRTPAWYQYAARSAAHNPKSATAAAAELYVKPDDRWEVNDVANRCPEVVELLAALVGETALASAAPVALADVLISGLQ